MYGVLLTCFKTGTRYVNSVYVFNANVGLRRNEELSRLVKQERKGDAVDLQVTNQK